MPVYSVIPSNHLIFSEDTKVITKVPLPVVREAVRYIINSKLKVVTVSLFGDNYNHKIDICKRWEEPLIRVVLKDWDGTKLCTWKLHEILPKEVKQCAAS